MTPLITAHFRCIAAALVLVMAAGCQRPGEPNGRNHMWVGTLPMRDTGFDRRTWQDTPIDVVRPLMERLPDRIPSAAEHRLARNLLISIAEAPQGDDGGALLTRRVDALMRLGNVGDAAALSRAARNPPRDEADARREIEAELLAGNVEMGCIDLRALAARSSTQWVRDGMALCNAHAGEPGVTPPPDTGRLGALARIGGAPLPADPPSDEPAGSRIAYLAAVGSDAKIPAARRLDAAFAVARASALGGGAYAKILRAAPARGQAPSGGEPPASGEQAASLFQAIDRSPDPRQKLALAERGLLSPDGAIDGVSAAMVEPLRTVRPDPALATLAPRFAICFYAVGDVKAATPWADLAKRSGSDSAIWSYRALLKPPGSGELADWEKRSHLDPAGRDRIVAILSAFGVASPEQSGDTADDTQEIDKAATQLHVGETTLRALVLLGSAGPAGVSPRTLHHVLKSLDRVALHDEARALAFEAMTAVVLARAAPHKNQVAASNASVAVD